MKLTHTYVYTYPQQISYMRYITYGATGLLLILTSLCTEPLQMPTHPGYCAGLLASLTIMSNLVCHWLYLRLYKQYSTTLLTIADNIMFLFTALYSWLFLYETITWPHIFSGCVILLATALYYQHELRQVRA